MHFLYDFLPVLLFFIAFKWFGIYVATIVGIAMTALQVLITYFLKKKFDKQQVFTLFIFSLFGGMTLYFHNPIFVKWKPSIIFWIFGVVFLITQFIGQKTLVQRMMEHMLQQKTDIPVAFWKRLNLAWSLFFIFLGTLNIYIAYQYSTDTWVNFKFYGIFGLVFLFTLAQTICLARYLSDTK